MWTGWIQYLYETVETKQHYNLHSCRIYCRAVALNMYYYFLDVPNKMATEFIYIIKHNVQFRLSVLNQAYATM